jgi:hypothetical protein
MDFVLHLVPFLWHTPTLLDCLGVVKGFFRIEHAFVLDSNTANLDLGVRGPAENPPTESPHGYINTVAERNPPGPALASTTSISIFLNQALTFRGFRANLLKPSKERYPCQSRPPHRAILATIPIPQPLKPAGLSHSNSKFGAKRDIPPAEAGGESAPSDRISTHETEPILVVLWLVKLRAALAPERNDPVNRIRRHTSAP